jgi:hypothetical protein
VFHIVSNAVPDQVNQHHLGVAFAGGIALSPVPETKARAFVSTVDGDAKLLPAEKAEKRLLSMIEQAIICRRGVAAQVTDAIASSKAYASDLKKLTKDDARPAIITAQCDAYATDLAGSVAFDADCREWHSARFLASHVDHVAGFDPAAIRIALADLASLDNTISTGRDALRDAIAKIHAVRAEAANRGDTAGKPAIAPSILAELTALKAASAAIANRLDAVARKLGVAS